MACLPTSEPFAGQMLVNMPYMEHLRYIRPNCVRAMAGDVYISKILLYNALDLGKFY